MEPLLRTTGTQAIRTIRENAPSTLGGYVTDEEMPGTRVLNPDMAPARTSYPAPPLVKVWDVALAPETTYT